MLPVQEIPSPVNPVIHSHRYEPSVLVHSAKLEQLSAFKLHSSTSAKNKDDRNRSSELQETKTVMLPRQANLSYYLNMDSGQISELNCKIHVLLYRYIIIHFFNNPTNHLFSKLSSIMIVKELF